MKDRENSELQQSKKPARVVFSVAFSPGDFERIAAFAERNGVKTSAFIREAALDRALKPEGTVTCVFGSGSLGAIWVVDDVPTDTTSEGLLDTWQYSAGA